MDNAIKKYKIKKDKSFYLLIVLSILFVILTICVFTHLFDRVDSSVSSFILGIRNDKLTNTMSLITNIGGSYSLISISIIVFIISIIRTRKPSFIIIINLVSVFITSQLFKLIFHRLRPNNVFLAYANGYSYPSGHTMVSTAYFAVVTYLLCKHIKNKTLKVMFNLINLVLILVIAFSRLYLGVHYFSDILAGYLLSFIYLAFFFKIINSKEISS